MLTIAYCAIDWKEASEAAANATPFTCPPVAAVTADIEHVLDKACKADLFYLNLHGYPNQPYLYGQTNKVIGPTALTVEQIKARRWDGVVIFAEVCFSALDGGGPIAQAFLDNGAAAFIGSTTEAYGRTRPVTIFDGEADRLMALFRRCYSPGSNPSRALKKAKRWLRVLSIPLDADDKATLASFVCLEKK